MGIAAPSVNWYWPVRALPGTSGEESQEENQASDDLVESDDEKTKPEIPPTPEIPTKTSISSADEEEEEEKEIDDVANAEETSEKLIALTNYLRQQHQFCVWCGIKFENDEDMQINCPGPTAEAHE